MTVDPQTARLVQRRAAERCEYCRMHQSLQGATFHVEHVIPRSRGGDSELSNLAWACPSRNLRKGSATKAIDPVTAEAADLFHPRRDHWKAHFEWEADKLVGLTDKGRATVAFLQLNSERRLQIRKAERLFRFHPPPS